VRTVSSGRGGWVTLDDEEFDIGRHLGAIVRSRGVLNDLQERKVLEDASFIQEVGEITTRAVAKQLGIYSPDPRHRFRKLGDLPGEVEVRSVLDDNNGLRVHDADPDVRRCVLIVFDSKVPRGPYRIPGWYVAGDAKQLRWQMRPHRDSFCVVPQDELRPLSELRFLLHLEVIAVDRVAAGLEAIGAAIERASTLDLTGG
jgi:hypothetical protein